MYKYIGDTDIQWYTFINDASRWLAFVFILFLFMHVEKANGRLTDLILNGTEKKKKKTPMAVWYILVIAEAFITTFVQFKLGGLNGFFGDLVGTGANYFGTLFISPIIMSLFALLFGWDIYKLMDIVTLAYPFRLIFVKLACFCQGCCRGFECSFGLYNHSSKLVEFPVQLVEMGLAAAIFIFLLLKRKKLKEGTMFPIYVILYSSTRFFSEFFRCEENVFLFLKKYHILCLIGVATGFLLLQVAEKYKERIRRFYGDYFDAVEDTLNDIAIRMGIKRKHEIIHHGKKKNTKRSPVQSFDKKTRISNMKKWIIVWTLGLMGQIGWNIEGAWFNTFVYEKIDKTPSILTPMLIASAVATTVAILFFGTLTDRTGKRRTLVSFGFFFWGVLTIGFSFTQQIAESNLSLAIVYMVAMDSLLSFFASIGIGVGYNTWLTDIMNDSNRGQIGGAIAAQSVLGTLLGNILGGYIIGQENNYFRLFVVVGSSLSLLGMISVFLFDKKDDAKRNVSQSYFQQLTDAFNFRSLKKNKELLLVYAIVAIYFVGYQSYIPHLGNTLIDYLGYSPSQTGIIQAVPLLFAILATLPVSKFINQNKVVQVSLLSIIFCLAGNSLVFRLTPEDVDTSKIFNIRLFVTVFLVGCSFIIMTQTTKSWAKSLYPKNEKGRYECLWSIANSLIPTLFGSNIGEWIVKNSGEGVFNTMTQRYEYIPNGNVFMAGAIISSFSIIPIIITAVIMKKRSSAAEQKKQL